MMSKHGPYEMIYQDDSHEDEDNGSGLPGNDRYLSGLQVKRTSVDTSLPISDQLPNSDLNMPLGELDSFDNHNMWMGDWDLQFHGEDYNELIDPLFRIQDNFGMGGT